MNDINSLCIQKFHQHRVDQYGAANAKSLGWFTKESQYKHFDILTQIGVFANTSILDIGCGNGDLCFYLNQKYTNIHYFGIDFMETFLDNALEMNADFEKVTFYKGDFMMVDLPIVSFTLVSGSLNYKNSDPDYIFKALSKLYHTCKIAFGFNLLSKTINADGILVAYSPSIIKAFCETLSNKVIVIEDYEENEFTVFVYKE